MKSMFSLGAKLGIVSSAIVGSAIFGTMSAFSLPQDQIVQKLGPVPVFTITDAKGAPLVASNNDNKKEGGVAGVFINQKDAEAFVNQLKTKNPELAKNVRVVPVSLGEVYKLDQASSTKPNSLDFAYVPAKQQVDAAMALLKKSGQDEKKFQGTPLFVAKAGKEKGYLTVKQADKQVIPFFFNKEELQSMLDRFKKQQPNLASTVEIQVVNLEGVIETMQSRNDTQLNQIMLVPPKASIDFVRSLPAAQPRKK
ncbi:Tic22 family protein [Chlorogloea sp. CCALA 695]|uniref:Tic22 family protein n=1 Tax=Chlorogloea sp. CCALA 695 TaxID=2107693 RepID=UPI000D0851E8|nr:Tic22 family protein [Chlorogloea sp. CCALA 695]PSB34058.1 hypothetical protein C7B70_05370 [Chlorogloea sp. CCALA 695]